MIWCRPFAILFLLWRGSSVIDIWVITFFSVTHALRAEKILKNKKISVTIIPIPRELSGPCEGLAAQLQEDDLNQAVAFLEENGIEMARRGVKVSR